MFNPGLKNKSLAELLQIRRRRDKPFTINGLSTLLRFGSKPSKR
jgi:hypothetical protein